MSAIIDYATLEYDKLPYPRTVKRIYDWLQCRWIVVESIDIGGKRSIDASTGHEVIAPKVQRAEKKSKHIVVDYLREHGPSTLVDVAQKTYLDTSTVYNVHRENRELFVEVAPKQPPKWQLSTEGKEVDIESLIPSVRRVVLELRKEPMHPQRIAENLSEKVATIKARISQHRHLFESDGGVPAIWAIK